MRSLSIRARVAIAAAVAIVAAVVLLGAAIIALLDDQLEDTLDESLRARATEVARLAASTPALLDEPGALEGRLGGAALFVEVIDRRGRIVARSAGLGGRVLPAGSEAVRAARARRAAGYGDDRLGAEPVRIYAAPLGELGSGPAAGGAVIVAGTTAENERTLDDTRTLVAVAALVAAALAALLATLLSARALLPLRRLSRGARSIERSGDASARLPAPAARDEVGELAATLNAMLESLERARETERRFVGDASHELRTPLTALRGNVAYVARHGAEPGVVADLEADAERLSTLLDDLLALAREDAAAPPADEPVDLAEIARAYTEGQVLQASKPTSGVAVQDLTPVLVVGDRAALERAVGNLVANAHAHGPPGGRVTIAVERVGDQRARITVEDDGPGIAPEHAAHAFERFWRAPGTRGEGSGLGLAIVRAIAERHGGSVSVDGSRFTIELPALTDLSKPARRKTA